VGKASRNKNKDSIQVTTVQNPDQSRSWFLPVVVAIVVAGAALIGWLAIQRDTNVGVQPEALVDHWHTAYGVYNCDSFDASIVDSTDPEGVHTHSDGVIHVHPFSTTASGDNATLDAFFRANGAVLSDDSFTYGPLDGGATMSESDGCNGEPATLTVAYWDNALLAEQGDQPTVVITEDLDDLKFEGDISAVTIALLPAGTTEIPAPPTIPNLQTLTDLG